MRKRSAGVYGMFFIRYGIGSILVVAGVVMLIVSPGGFGVEGFGMSAGSGFSVLMLNFLYRLGVTGDAERRREEDARSYLARHGHWPDQRPTEQIANPAAGPEAEPVTEPAPDRATEHRAGSTPASHEERPTRPPRRHRRRPG